MHAVSDVYRWTKLTWSAQPRAYQGKSNYGTETISFRLVITKFVINESAHVIYLHDVTDLKFLYRSDPYSVQVWA